MTDVLEVLQGTEMTAPEIRGYILAVQEKLLSLPNSIGPNDPITPLKHTFVNGIYTREIFIPKGMLVVGKIHKHAHPNFLMSGDVSVLTEEGAKRLKGPMALVSPAGTKRLLYTHEDTVWVTVHANPDNKEDLVELEDEIIAKTYADLPEQLGQEFIKQIENAR